MNVAVATRQKLAKLRRFEKRVLKRGALLGLLLFTAVLFACGVIDPMVWADAPRWIYVTVPIAGYGIGSLVAIGAVFRLGSRYPGS